MAERVGFEPTEPFSSRHFECRTLNRSDIPPYKFSSAVLLHLTQNVTQAYLMLHGDIVAALCRALPCALLKKETAAWQRPLFMAGVAGFEPALSVSTLCQSQSLVPYRLAIPQYAYFVVSHAVFSAGHHSSFAAASYFPRGVAVLHAWLYHGLYSGFVAA